MHANAAPRLSRLWLDDLFSLKPAPWHWPRAIRAGLSVGLPFASGILLGDIMTGMWIAMGTLMMTTGESSGPYGIVMRKLALAAPLGAVGYLAGYLTGLPWLGVVLAMAAVGLLAGLASQYGATLSIGCLQLLLTASIAIGVPAIAPFWEPALLYLVGAIFYGVLLGIEALVCGQRPRRDAVTRMLYSLADLADTRAAGAPISAARRAVTQALSDLRTNLPPPPIARADIRGFARIADQGDAVFVQLTSVDDAHALPHAAAELRQWAAADVWRAPGDGTSSSEPLQASLQALATTLAMPAGDGTAQSPASVDVTVASRQPGLPARDGVLSAMALALCLGLAYATHWYNAGGHWFWVPLTIGLVMKPDLGSIFARSVLRTAGTAIGVILGAILLAWVPKSLAFAIIMGVLAGILPWAMQRSYGLQAIVLTPLVLMLVDVIAPGTGSVDDGAQRLLDTLIGGAIVVVFGYAIWPRRPFADAFARARQAVAQYLLTLADSTAHASVSQPARSQAYAALAALRSRWQASRLDPPPTNAEADRWLARLDRLEQLCDTITRHAGQPERARTPDERQQLQQVAHAVAQGQPLPADLLRERANAAGPGLVHDVAQAWLAVDGPAQVPPSTARPATT